MSSPAKAKYPKDPYIICKGQTVLSCGRMPKVVDVPCEHVGACIVVHGVNDVGTSYPAVEAGLVDGIARRMGWDPCRKGLAPPYTAARYRLPTGDDASRLEDDPDAVFYKRSIDSNTASPVIPFYWGYRVRYDSKHRDLNGQKTDAHGNRLDKDLSKGGGPFANATSNLADMWNRGASEAMGVPDALAQDPYRPVLPGPGRMYFVLAAQRLAALVSMIRDYDEKETVNIIAHSQGCLVSLLAQAFLMDQGQTPADTLILTHPPYGLEPVFLDRFSREKGNEDQKKDGNERSAPATTPAAGQPPAPAPAGKDAVGPSTGGRGGEDHAMKGLYEALEKQQNVRARLDTLINIVKGVSANRRSGWSDAELTRMGRAGVHSTAWRPADDRDNRGKVYLYFCPEDMTVGLRNVQGIGWQGVPNRIGERPSVLLGTSGRTGAGSKVRVGDSAGAREPLAELGPSFFQRVFTAKLRRIDKVEQVFRVGLPPQDFPLRTGNESDRDHVAGNFFSNRIKFAQLPAANGNQFPERRRLPRDPLLAEDGVRYINGEPLKEPHVADLLAGALESTDKSKVGKFEGVDPIDAAIAVTSDYGVKPAQPQLIDDPRPGHGRGAIAGGGAPTSRTLLPREMADVEAQLNENKPEGDKVKLTLAVAIGDGRLVIHRPETPNEARLRHQQSTSARSFHSAIWASQANHEKVTAYDIAVGQGLAVSNPSFYSYLCAVADWRLKRPAPKEQVRKGILTWQQFSARYACYFDVECPERKEIIKGSCEYYSRGELPPCIPSIAGRPSAVEVETTGGRTVPLSQSVQCEK